jgi:hypothetical protein
MSEFGHVGGTSLTDSVNRFGFCFGFDDDDDDDDDDRARRRGTRGVREEKARDVGMINLFAAKVRAARATITTRWWCLFNWK